MFFCISFQINADRVTDAGSPEDKLLPQALHEAGGQNSAGANLANRSFYMSERATGVTAT